MSRKRASLARIIAVLRRMLVRTKRVNRLNTASEPSSAGMSQTSWPCPARRGSQAIWRTISPEGPSRATRQPALDRAGRGEPRGAQAEILAQGAEKGLVQPLGEDEQGRQPFRHGQRRPGCGTIGLAAAMKRSSGPCQHRRRRVRLRAALPARRREKSAGAGDAGTARSRGVARPGDAGGRRFPRPGRHRNRRSGRRAGRRWRRPRSRPARGQDSGRRRPTRRSRGRWRRSPA